jgi:hypothetical protein
MRPLASSFALLAALTCAGAYAQQPTAKQMQAIRQACATGALSPEECAQKGVGSRTALQGTADGSGYQEPQNGFPSPRGAGGQGQTYQDPQRRFRLTVPAGWNVAVDNGNAAFSFDQAKVQTICASAHSGKEEAETVAKQYGGAFQDLKIFNQGAFKAGAHEAYGINFDGTLKGTHYSMLVMAIAAGGDHYLTLVSYMPSAQAQGMNNTVIGMANSVQF